MSLYVSSQNSCATELNLQLQVCEERLGQLIELRDSLTEEVREFSASACLERGCIDIDEHLSHLKHVHGSLKTDYIQKQFAYSDQIKYLCQKIRSIQVRISAVIDE